MSLESFIEAQIKKAMAEGQFDDLPGKGKPIDLKAYFDTPEHLRMAYSILKKADFVPEEVQLLKVRSRGSAVAQRDRSLEVTA